VNGGRLGPLQQAGSELTVDWRSIGPSVNMPNDQYGNVEIVNTLLQSQAEAYRS